MAKTRKEKGFILVILLSMLLLLAVTAMSLNVKSGMQAKMTANQSADAQTYFSQLAVKERAIWELTTNPFWRTAATGEARTYNGEAFTLEVKNSPITDYTDTVVISVRAPNAPTSGNKFLVNKSFRYNIDTPFLIRNPRQLCLDSAGNIFFADMDNHSVWKIDAVTGAILRVAGTGKSGFGGDGGRATEAQLDSPRGVSIDGLGNIYIADTNNNCIRKVAAGFISTVVNTSGIAGVSGDDGLATAARLSSAYGVFVDIGGNIYIADRSNHRIRKVTAATGIISTVAGTSQGLSGDLGAATLAKLDNPRSVFVDGNLNIFIADTGNDRIRKVTAATGVITTVAGTSVGFSGDGGAATAAKLDGPRSVVVDGVGNILIADTNNHRIRKVTSGTITTLAGTGTAGYTGDGLAATAARIDNPTGVALKSTGQVIISDTNNSCLRQVSITNTISTLPMTAGTGLNNPQGIAAYYDAAQKKLFLYIADQLNHRIRKLDTATNAITTVAGTGSAGSAGDGGQATAAQLNSPSTAAVDSAGNLYIADTLNHKIRKVMAIDGVITDSSCSSSCSIISTVAGTGVADYNNEGLATIKRINSPKGVSVDTAGNIYIADTNNHRIRIFTDGGNISTVAGNGTAGYVSDGVAATSTRINSPQGVAVDTSGNIYIADTANHRIRKFTVGGNISTVAGNGTAGYVSDGVAAISTRINSPQRVAVDTSGNIYIADTGNHRLRIVNHDTTPIISTLAGTGTSGYNGDNQPAVQARLSSPGGVALGLTKGGGRIYIGDTGNDRVRVLFLKTEPQVYGP